MSTATSTLGWELAKAIIILVLLLPLAYLVTRLVGRTKAARSGIVRIIEVVPLASGRFLYVVRFAGRLLLLGVTAHNVQLIAEIEEAEDVERLLADREALGAQGAFGKLFEERLARDGDRGREDS